MFVALAVLCCLGGEAVAGNAYNIRFEQSITNTSGPRKEDIEIALAIPTHSSTQLLDSLNINVPEGCSVQQQSDQYGQPCWLLRLSLNPNETKTVGYQCHVTFRPEPNKLLSASSAPSPLSSDEVELYTSDVPRIYNLSDSSIHNRAASFLSSYPDPVQRVRAIHQYLASSIKYDNRDGWDSASDVLKRGTGSCSEFTYLFGALCRATGLPTRYAGGSRLRKAIPYQDEQGHRWSEVYLPQRGWTACDPTLDSKNPASMQYAGTFFQPSFVTTYGGGGSRLLGNSYNSSMKSKAGLKVSKTFFWTD